MVAAESLQRLCVVYSIIIPMLPRGNASGNAPALPTALDAGASGESVPTRERGKDDLRKSGFASLPASLFQSPGFSFSGITSAIRSRNACAFCALGRGGKAHAMSLIVPIDFPGGWGVKCN
jgi:hypothetical protein